MTTTTNTKRFTVRFSVARGVTLRVAVDDSVELPDAEIAQRAWERARAVVAARERRDERPPSFTVEGRM